MCPRQTQGRLKSIRTATITPCFQNGFTFIELILSMMIISIALTGVLTVMNQTIMHSADPLIQHQAVAIAESYLEEILLQSYDDPDGIEGESSRILYDDVDDYNNLPDNRVRDQQGNLLSAVSNFTITTTVSSPITLADSVLAKKITVNVTGSGTRLVLVAYRANY